MKTNIQITLTYLEGDYVLIFKRMNLNDVFKSIPPDLVSKSTLFFDEFVLGGYKSAVGGAGAGAGAGGVVTDYFGYRYSKKKFIMFFTVLFQNLEKCEKFYDVLKNNFFEE